MTDAVTVLREALALPESDRADIAAELLASLPPPPGTLEVDSAEWALEIERRARRVQVRAAHHRRVRERRSLLAT